MTQLCTIAGTCTPSAVSHMHAWQLMCFQEEEGWPCDSAVHHSRHVHTECTMEQSAICMHGS